MKLTHAQLGRWFHIAASRLLGIPEASFAAPVEARPHPKNLRGLKTGINDLLAASNHGGNEVAADRALREAGLPTVEEMRASLKRKETGILRRGVIRNEEEYYIVQEVLSDGLASRRSTTIRKLGTLVAAYEESVKSLRQQE